MFYFVEAMATILGMLPGEIAEVLSCSLWNLDKEESTHEQRKEY
jgi:hypothetical protein